ncbi:hypothetical protein ABEF95_004200 [Exophiala dermatitidis]
MATTPPAQITASPETPPTPLHGAAYDRETHRSLRRATRTSNRIASSQLHSEPVSQRRSSQRPSSVATPKSPVASSADTSSGLHSPQLTPKNKGRRRVQVISPSSPDQHTSKLQPDAPLSSHLQPFPSSSAATSETMLPTPVKTPQKKMPPKVRGAARALFQDATHNVPAPQELAPSPRRSRRNKRYNGFSLESFSVEDGGGQGQIQIFTDSRDALPQLDTSISNPFMTRAVNAEDSSTRKVPGTVKRRKVSGQNRMDPQVEEAIRKDEGMVYVFRGKKVYRRFDDGGEEEEEIDPEELGLLEHTPSRSSVRPLKTLTRRSIKPTRLFQTEKLQRAAEAEKEEEAPTDIEDDEDSGTVRPDQSNVSKSNDPVSAPSTVRSLRSSKKPNTIAADEIPQREVTVHQQAKKAKQGSPFDTWPRVKSGMRSSGTSAKFRKRSADESLDDNTESRTVESKRSRT